MNKINIHPDFKLNTKKYSQRDLLVLAQQYILSDKVFLQELGKLIIGWFDEESFIIAHSSGTTGTPKKIKLEKKAVEVSARATGAFFNIPNKSTALLCMSCQFIGAKLMFIRALILGWELDVVEPSSTPLKDIDKYYDFVAMVPMQVSKSIEELSKVGKLIVGGAPLDENLSIKVKQSSCIAFETYGMTETITHIAAKKVGDSYFTALNHARIGVDQRGCLWIDAPQIHPSRLITNDVVELCSENTFIWKGRWDNVINSGGVKLYPEVIEKKLAPYISSRFIILGLQDQYLGQKVVLVIEAQPYIIDAQVFNALSPYEKPKQIVFVEAFKETASGKIIRNTNIN